MIQRIGGYVNHLHFEPPDSNSDFSFSSFQSRYYEYYGSYQPVYIDFDPDSFLVVKARTPIYPYSNMTRQKEVILLYTINLTDSGKLYWGLTPDQYYSFEDQKIGSGTRFDITKSLPVVVPQSYFIDSAPKLFLTQNTATLQRKESNSSENKIKPKNAALFKAFKNEVFSNFVLTEVNTSKVELFRRMNLTLTKIKLKEKVYNGSANSTALKLNQNTGALGAHTSLILFKNLILNLQPKPLPPTSNGFQNLPLWLLILMVFGVILLVSLVLLFIMCTSRRCWRKGTRESNSSVDESETGLLNSFAKIHLYGNFDETVDDSEKTEKF